MGDVTLIDQYFHDQSEYLAKRGISKKVASALKLEFASATMLKELGIEWRGIEKGIVWKIRGPNGIETGDVGARVWYAGGDNPRLKRPKFITPKGQSPRLYFSPIAKWNELSRGDTVILCESYLKADIAALCGFYAIGISGVWGWSKDKRIIDDFALLPWKELELKLIACFDSNVQRDVKDLLSLAVERLAAEFERLGTGVECAYLPGPDEGSWGLDDYYMVHGKDGVRSVIAAAIKVETGLNEHLRVMNSEVAVVRTLSRIVDLETGALMTREGFANIIYANRISWNADGKPVSVAKSWLGWNGRREVMDVGYFPGCGKIHENSYNLWDGMGCNPEEGDCSLWEDWLMRAFPSREDRDWFCCWWATQLQNPGIKLTTALVLTGVSGVGKGWIAALMRRVFGDKNTAIADLSAVGSRFNSDFSNKMLLIVEESELPQFDGDKIYAKIKDLLTNERIRVERKGVDAFTVDNHVNIMLQSNRVDLFKIDEFDRRLAVFDILGEGIANVDSYWAPRWEALNEGLPEFVYQWLLDYDCSGFNPKGAAPMTQAKREMIETTHDPREQWIMELKNNYEEVMVVGGESVDGVIATAKELEFVYRGGEIPIWELPKKDVDAMNKKLRTLRVPYANGGGKIKTPAGSHRYFLLKPGMVEPKEGWGRYVQNRKFWKKHGK